MPNAPVQRPVAQRTVRCNRLLGGVRPDGLTPHNRKAMTYRIKAAEKRAVPNADYRPQVYQARLSGAVG